jgi:hypothetical protein
VPLTGAWNGCDSILKERAFGLIGNEGNHGEDLKKPIFTWMQRPPTATCITVTNIPKVHFPIIN